jgi:6-pyruvoyltetrahydropterin/6-carboxytetrahydropterin synthase
MKDKVTTCSKLYSDIPFAHRQPNHDGHCALIHGHNWSFKFTFVARNLDANGFVIDFGKLKPLKAALYDLDHATVLNETDPSLRVFEELEKRGIMRVVRVPDCSAEGLALWALDGAERIVHNLSGGRVSVSEVTCYEDSKNEATVSIQ